MSSTGSWTEVQSLSPDAMDTDSEAGSDSFSIITIIAFNEGSGSGTGFEMAQDGPTSASASASHASNVLDWVQQQSVQDETSSLAPASQHVHVDTPLPRPAELQDKQSDVNPPSARQEPQRAAKKVYDIATLLRLRETQGSVPVMLRVKPEAIAGKLLPVALLSRR